ncbi:MAG: BREX system P-loop protein BrxC [Nannocystaceae bacterium]
MSIRELFLSQVDRDIPPVVYFHEQSAEKLAAEVREYIITGGWPEGHKNHKRVPQGIHENYVRLLERIAGEMGKAGGPDLPPAVWISGFYGSGKSSFAKLLGLALDGKKLPDGTDLGEAWLRRDTSPRRDELRAAWAKLQSSVRDPLSIVFDIGGVARGDEQIHSALVRQLQARLGYCDKDPMVADYELKLERDGHYDRFLEVVDQELALPWDELKHTHMVEDDFSTVLSVMFPKNYPDPTSWVASRAGQMASALSAEDATKAIRDMLRFRAEGRTLFVVVDEVSQYIFQDVGRMLALQSLVSSLGERLKGQVWLLATGQQKLDDQNQADVLGKLKDRFPAALRVHLGATNIRDVVHRRLLHKKPGEEPRLRELFSKYRSNLQLFAYECQEITEEDFVEIYPMLPQHIDLILQITSALRTRSSRSQGDDHAIRGLLQMLGELFRGQGVADMPVGRLITLDQIYEVQCSALDSDVQTTMARVLEYCAREGNDEAARCAKAVALLQLLAHEEGGLATDAKLVARCLYGDITRGSNEAAVTEALERLRGENLLGYSEKSGYKIQSSAGQEWERDRQSIGIAPEDLGELLKESLEHLIGDRKERPKFRGRGFVWQGLFSDEHRFDDAQLRGPRDETPIVVDFRAVPMDLQDRASWVNRSTETQLSDRVIWVISNHGAVQDAARELAKSLRMVKRFQNKRESLAHDRRRLLLEEEARSEDLTSRLRKTVSEAFLGGRIYHAGADFEPHEHGTTFSAVLVAVGNRCLPNIYSQFDATTVTPAELKQLLQKPLAGPDSKFFAKELGILDEDAGRIVATCEGPIPKRVCELIERDQGISGATLLTKFSAPPYGYTGTVVKACVAGLLHGGRIRIRPAGESEVTSVVDKGVQNLFEKERVFKQADIFPAGEARIKVQDRNRIRNLFKTVFERDVVPENEPIADVVGEVLPPLGTQLADVERALSRLPNQPETPQALVRLRKAAEDCLRERQVEPRVLQVKRHLDALRDGVGLLNTYRLELTEQAAADVRRAHDVLTHQLGQLFAVGEVDARLQDIEKRLAEQLKQERPWKDIGGVEADVEAIRSAYAQVRRQFISNQEKLADEARSKVKLQEGFAGLTADERHRVLRRIQGAVVETSEEAIAPELSRLRDGVKDRMREAEGAAIQLLDELRSRTRDDIVVKVSLSLRNREIRSREDVDSLLDEIRTRLLEQLDKNEKIRIRLD